MTTPAHPSQAQEFHIEVSSPCQLLDCLSEHTPLSRQQLKDAMAKGALWITPAGKDNNSGRQLSRHTRRLRRHKKPLLAGDQLHLYYNPELLQQTPPEASLIEDAGDYSVWYKPSGMLSQGSKWSDHCTLTRWAEQHLSPQRSAFLVHRLDRATRGIMVVAHAKHSARQLSRAFEQRQIDKRYQAIVHGDFHPDTITCREEIEGKSAISHFAKLDYCSKTKRSLVDVKIDTGRKHQIRRHLSTLSFPIVGDRLYGIAQQGDEDLQLCAYRLSLPDLSDSQAPLRTYQLTDQQGLSFTSA